MRQSLALPDAWEPQAMIFLGHAAEQPPMRERKSLQETTLFL
ncbi:MAG: hypothetical protein WHV44_09375 [Anaerolineales bacterium]